MVRQKSFMQVLSERWKQKHNAPVPDTSSGMGNTADIIEKAGYRVAHVDLQSVQGAAWPDVRTGTIFSMRLNEQGIPCAYVDQDGVLVELPYSDVLVTPAGNEIDIKTAQRHLAKMVGAEIDYIVDSHTGRTATASRKAAMAWRRAEELPKIHTGDTVQARVVAVMKRIAILEVAGVEKEVEKQEFSWEWIPSLYEFIKVGQSIPAAVASISHEDQTLSLSPRALQENPFLQSGWMYEEKTRCAGVVTGQLDCFYYVRLKGPLTCMCRLVPDIANRPIVGSAVMLLITYKDNKRQRLYGRILSVDKL